MFNENTQQTIVAVNVAAELYHAQQITRSLSISSKNLRTLAKRIGQSAAGLAILASFYDECSRESIALADQVSKMTISTTGKAVKEWRTSLFEQQLEKAIQSLNEQQIPEIVRDILIQKPSRETINAERILKEKRELNDLLIDMQKNIRSIAVIAVNSKIEAPRTGEHSAVLLDMAKNVEEMISKILKHIDSALHYLSSNSSEKR